LLLAVFFLFCIFGFFGDLMAGGRTAYQAVVVRALYSGITAALIDASTTKPEIVLPSLMKRLNCVLPSVKEAQLYATFAGFRLNADGSIFYALAAHPPILHYKAIGDPRYLSAEQFPIGLLPVDDFTSERAMSTPGDLFIALTDGIIEACSKKQEEFGFDRVQAVIAAHATMSLPVLADAILTSARAFGQQIDDQTLLLIRRL
jgi:serine phosphatase RsbU (regulator of sigma subunit)